MECNNCKMESKLGEGGYGKVYLTCCDDGCDYATKIIDISEEDEERYKSANKELVLSDLMSDENVGPKICKKYSNIVNRKDRNIFIIVMEKFQMTMNNYVIEYWDINSEMQLKIYKVIYKFHKLGFVHLDLHLKNLMIDKKGNVKIIDFGFTIESKSKLLRFFDYFFFTYKNLKILEKEGILFKLYKQKCREFNVKFSSEPQEFYKQFEDIKDNEFVDIVKKNLELYKNKEKMIVKSKCKFIIVLANLYRYWNLRKNEEDIEKMLGKFFI